MEIPILSESEYLELKEKLHHAHDKIWKMIFMLLPAMREYVEKVIAPQLQGVSFDLDALKLDNTSYLNPKLQPFYSDLVYLTTMTDQNGTQQPVKIALLLEHKSIMPTALQLRIQLLEYIVAMQHRNYDETEDSTIVVIPNVFNQFDKGWEIKPFRSLFKDLSPSMADFIPEYKILLTNLPDFSPETIATFEKYGELRAGILAMKHVRNKKFLLAHFEDIFVFLERHPERETMRNQLVTYLLSASDLSPQELEELLKNIFTPILKKEVKMYGTGFIAAAARETEERVRKEEQKMAQVAAQKAQVAAEKAREAALQLKTRTILMQGWLNQLPVDLMAVLVGLPVKEITLLIQAFEQAKTYFESKERVSIKRMIDISGLSAEEVTVLVKILKETKKS